MVESTARRTSKKTPQPPARPSSQAPDSKSIDVPGDPENALPALAESLSPSERRGIRVRGFLPYPQRLGSRGPRPWVHSQYAAIAPAQIMPSTLIRTGHSEPPFMAGNKRRPSVHAFSD